MPNDIALRFGSLAYTHSQMLFGLSNVSGCTLAAPGCLGSYLNLKHLLRSELGHLRHCVEPSIA